MFFRRVACVVLLTLVGAACSSSNNVPEVDESGEQTTPPSDPTAGIEGVEVFADLPNGHVDDPVYDDVPPVGGDHIGIWANCGFYGVEIPLGNVVHTIEHGVVWLAFGGDVSGVEVDALVDIVSVNPDRMIASRVDALDADIYAVAWERRLKLDGADDPRLADFVAAFTDTTSPENGARCTGGVG